MDGKFESQSRLPASSGYLAASSIATMQSVIGFKIKPGHASVSVAHTSLGKRSTPEAGWNHKMVVVLGVIIL